MYQLSLNWVNNGLHLKEIIHINELDTNILICFRVRDLLLTLGFFVFANHFLNCGFWKPRKIYNYASFLENVWLQYIRTNVIEFLRVIPNIIEGKSDSQGQGTGEGKKGLYVLRSRSKAGPGRNFSQPRTNNCFPLTKQNIFHQRNVSGCLNPSPVERGFQSIGAGGAGGIHTTLHRENICSAAYWRMTAYCHAPTLRIGLLGRVYVLC